MTVVADSLSAIRYVKVRVVRDETGLITDYQTEGEFPHFGNNDNRVDQLAAWIVSTFMKKLRKYPTYRNELQTQSILTITSNLVYGKSTGNTPDGRRHGQPFALGATPCTAEITTASMLRKLQWPRFLIATQPMEFLLRFRWSARSRQSGRRSGDEAT
jgi:pyruvate-formate lyase